MNFQPTSSFPSAQLIKVAQPIIAAQNSSQGLVSQQNQTPVNVSSTAFCVQSPLGSPATKPAVLANGLSVVNAGTINGNASLSSSSHGTISAVQPMLPHSAVRLLPRSALAGLSQPVQAPGPIVLNGNDHCQRPVLQHLPASLLSSSPVAPTAGGEVHRLANPSTAPPPMFVVDQTTGRLVQLRPTHPANGQSGPTEEQSFAQPLATPIVPGGIVPSSQPAVSAVNGVCQSVSWRQVQTSDGPRLIAVPVQLSTTVVPTVALPTKPISPAVPTAVTHGGACITVSSAPPAAALSMSQQQINSSILVNASPSAIPISELLKRRSSALDGKQIVSGPCQISQEVNIPSQVAGSNMKTFSTDVPVSSTPLPNGASSTLKPVVSTTTQQVAEGTTGNKNSLTDAQMQVVNRFRDAMSRLTSNKVEQDAFVAKHKAELISQLQLRPDQLVILRNLACGGTNTVPSPTVSSPVSAARTSQAESATMANDPRNTFPCSPVKHPPCLKRVSMAHRQRQIAWVKSQIVKDQNEVVRPQYEVPFRSAEDACKRLLRYHIYYQPNHSGDPSESDNDNTDVQNADQATWSATSEKIGKLYDKYQSLMASKSARNELDGVTEDVVMMIRRWETDEKQALAEEKARFAEGRIPLVEDALEAGTEAADLPQSWAEDYCRLSQSECMPSMANLSRTIINFERPSVVLSTRSSDGGYNNVRESAAPDHDTSISTVKVRLKALPDMDSTQSKRSKRAHSEQHKTRHKSGDTGTSRDEISPVSGQSDVPTHVNSNNLQTDSDSTVESDTKVAVRLDPLDTENECPSLDSADLSISHAFSDLDVPLVGNCHDPSQGDLALTDPTGHIDDSSVSSVFADSTFDDVIGSLDVDDPLLLEAAISNIPDF